MKLIITESQLRLIIENEDENLLDFTPFYQDFSPNKWDDMFEHINKKKRGIYDGYYITKDVDLYDSDVTELKYLINVGGRLNLSLSKIKSLPKLKYVGEHLFLDYTPLSKTTTEEELRSKINVVGDLYLWK